MRGIETIDSELRLVVAIRRMIREEEGRTPSTWHIDQVGKLEIGVTRPSHVARYDNFGFRKTYSAAILPSRTTTTLSPV
jgi:hypothetical protein